MAIVPRRSLYSFFETGDIPTQEEFADLIDSYVHREEDGVFIYKPAETIKRFGIGISQPPYRLGIAAEGTIQNLISLHDINGLHQWSLNLDPLVSDLKGLNIAQETSAGSESRLFINQNSGNIGLGSLNPEQKLQLEGSSPATIVGLKMLNNATVVNNGWSIGHLQEEEEQRDGGFSIRSTVENAIERLFINPSGNVGINEPLPQTKLHVSLPLEDPNSVIGLTEDSGVVNIGPINQSIVVDSRGLQARQGEYIGETLNLEAATLNLQRIGGDILIHGDDTIENSRKVIVTNEGNIGVGVLDPVERIAIDGAIQLGNTDHVNEGTIRWSGIDFEGYRRDRWESLTGRTDSLKGRDYLFVNGNSEPIENGEELVLAVQKANDLALNYNTKSFFIEEIKKGSYFYFNNEFQWSGGRVVSISIDRIVFEGNLQMYYPIDIPFRIHRFEVEESERHFISIDINDDFPVISNASYDDAKDETIFSLSRPFNEYYNYRASSGESTRVTVVVAPGRYKLAETLVLSDDNVDLISLTGNPDVELDLTDDHFYTGIVDFSGAGGPVFEVENDPFVIFNVDGFNINVNFVLSIEASCFVKGIRTKNYYSRTFEELMNRRRPDVVKPKAASRPSGFIANYPLPIDVTSTTDYIRIAPIVENCYGGNFSFGTSLGGDDYKVIDGIYRNNYALIGSFGTGCETWGAYDNNYGEYSFAYGGAAGGYFRHNIGRGHCFGDEAWGTFIDCIAGEQSFGSGEATGSFTNCTGGEGSFGNGMLSGHLYYCRLTSGKFNTVSFGGRTVYCIDGDNEHNNQ